MHKGPEQLRGAGQPSLPGKGQQPGPLLVGALVRFRATRHPSGTSQHQTQTPNRSQHSRPPTGEGVLHLDSNRALRHFEKATWTPGAGPLGVLPTEACLEGRASWFLLTDPRTPQARRHSPLLRRRDLRPRASEPFPRARPGAAGRTRGPGSWPDLQLLQQVSPGTHTVPRTAPGGCFAADIHHFPSKRVSAPRTQPLAPSEPPRADGV